MKVKDYNLVYGNPGDDVIVLGVTINEFDYDVGQIDSGNEYGQNLPGAWLRYPNCSNPEHNVYFYGFEDYSVLTFRTEDYYFEAVLTREELL